MSRNPSHSNRKEKQKHTTLLDPKEILWINGRERRPLKKSESETSVKISGTKLEVKKSRHRKTEPKPEPRERELKKSKSETSAKISSNKLKTKNTKKSWHPKQKPKPEPELEPEIGDSNHSTRTQSKASIVSKSQSETETEEEEPVQLQSILHKSRPTVTHDDGLTIVRPKTRVRIQTEADEDNQNSTTVSTREKARERARAQRKLQNPEPAAPRRKYFGLLDLRKPRTERGIHPHHVAVAGGFIVRRSKVVRKPQKPKPRLTSVLFPGADDSQDCEPAGVHSLLKEIKQSIKRGVWNVVESFSLWNPFPGAQFRQRDDKDKTGEDEDEDEEDGLPELDHERKREILHDATSTVHAIDAMFADSEYRASRMMSVEDKAAEERRDESERQQRELLNYIPRTQFTSQFAHLLSQARGHESVYREYRRRRPI